MADQPHICLLSRYPSYTEICVLIQLWPLHVWKLHIHGKVFAGNVVFPI